MAKTITRTLNYATKIHSGSSAPAVMSPQRGGAEFERFEDLTRKLAHVPKSELDEKRKAI